MPEFNESTFEAILGPNMPKRKVEERFDNDDSQAISDLLNDSLPEVLQELCNRAEAGDLSAIKEYTRLLLPKDGMQAYVHFDMPDDLDAITIDGVGRILKSILTAVGKGELSIQQATQLADIIDTLTHSLEIKELGVRLKDLESLIMQRLPVNKVNRKIRLIPLQQKKDGTYAE